MSDHSRIGLVVVSVLWACGGPEAEELAPNGPVTFSDEALGFGEALAAAPGWLLVASPGAGKVEAFTESEAGWRVAPEFRLSPGLPQYGRSLALDGDWLAVAASRPSTPGSFEAIVELHRRNDRGWVQVETYTSSRGVGPESLYGAALAIGSGQLAIGGPGGHVELINLATPQAPRVVIEGLAADGFGEALAIAGNQLFVGAPRRHEGRGAVDLYDLKLAGPAWVELRPEPGHEEGFGQVLSAHGNLLAVGIPKASGDLDSLSTWPGAVEVFEATQSGWVRRPVEGLPPLARQDELGSAVAVVGDRVLISAEGRNGKAGVVFGAQVEGGRAQIVAQFEAPAGSGARLGRAVALSGKTAVLGAPGRGQIEIWRW